MDIIKKSVLFALGCSMAFMAGQAHALGGQWYIGIGGSGSWLQPNPDDSNLDLTTEQGVGGNLFFGVDLDDRSSAQLTLYALGEAELTNEELIPYNAFDASVLYRIYDTKDARISRSSMSLALYGRFALGYMNRDTELMLNNDASVYFGAGGGLEWFITNNLSMRLEGMYHDQDVASGSLQFVARFGGAPRAPRRQAPQPTVPQPTLPQPTSPPVATLPAAPVTPAIPQPPTVPAAPQVPSAPVTVQDTDGDRVPDRADDCPGSAAGFPVRANGCSLFDGVLSGVNFAPGTAQLLPGASDQLDFLANVMVRYPQARVELHAHTDGQGLVKDQAILTRGRLRTIGTYLLERGVRANRLVLRSFGGTRPLYDNATPQGRQGNNRIEVIEKTN